MPQLGSRHFAAAYGYAAGAGYAHGAPVYPPSQQQQAYAAYGAPAAAARGAKGGAVSKVCSLTQLWHSNVRLDQRAVSLR